jgi:plastocyanin
MRRRIVLMVVAGLIGGLLATIPVLTASATSTLPMTASFTASDFQWTADGGGNSVNIAPGGTVQFSYPSGGSEHNVDFRPGALPTSCTANGTAQSPPVPSLPTGPGWTATCTFNTAGTYVFHCDRHTDMTGTIYVGDQTTTTTSTQGGTTSTGSTDTTMSMTMPMNMPMPTTTTAATTTTHKAPVARAALTAIKLSSARGGTQVRGTMKISAAGQGGHAVISVLASNAALGGHDRKLITLGRLRLGSLRAGVVAFKLSLKPVTRHALVARRHVTVTVQITLAAAGAQSVSITRRLVLTA